MSPYYKKEDLKAWVEGSSFSVKTMLKEMLAVDLETTVEQVEIPVYFFLGRHDYTTPSDIADKYLERLETPKKELVWFEESAHMPMMEEKEKFQEMVVKHFLETS